MITMWLCWFIGYNKRTTLVGMLIIGKTVRWWVGREYFLLSFAVDLKLI